MHESKNARGLAGPTRACDRSRDPSSSVSNEFDQPPKRTNLDAAVIAADHPEAHMHVRVVPEGAHVIRLGGAVAGYYKAHRSKYKFRSCRAHEIERLFLHRHPASEGVLPLPEDEIAFARALIAHAAPDEARAQLIRWRVEITPEVEKVLCDPKEWARRFKAEALGNLLRLTEDERDRLGITTFRATGQTAADQAEARRAKDRERKRAERARQSCGRIKPISAEQLRPWRGAGVSRRTWFRRKAEHLATHGTDPVRSNIGDKFAADIFSANIARSEGDQILSALTEPRSLREIEALTGLKLSTISPWLTRLRRARKVAPVQGKRGTWRSTDTTGGHQAAAQSINGPSTGSGKPACPFVDKTEDGRSEIDRLGSALRMLIRGSAAKNIASIGRRASVRLPSTTIFSNHDAERLGR